MFFKKIKIYWLAIKMYIRGSASWKACYYSSMYIYNGWQNVQK